MRVSARKTFDNLGNEIHFLEKVKSGDMKLKKAKEYKRSLNYI